MSRVFVELVVRPAMRVVGSLAGPIQFCRADPPITDDATRALHASWTGRKAVRGRTSVVAAHKGRRSYAARTVAVSRGAGRTVYVTGWPIKSAAEPEQRRGRPRNIQATGYD